jgi:predicted phage tail protein
VADLDFVYTASNVVDGLFNYAGGSYKNRYSSCLVSWSDPQNHYSDTIEGVYDSDLVARYDINQTQLTAIGCTSQSEAHRRGAGYYCQTQKTAQSRLTSVLTDIFRCLHPLLVLRTRSAPECRMEGESAR